MTTTTNTIQQVHIDLIDQLIPNHREAKLADDVANADLAKSMKLRGQLQPIGLYEHPDTPGRFVLCYGHRRLAAAQSLGWKTIMAEVRCWVSREDLLLNRAIENFQRQDLNVMEQVVAVEQAFKAANHELRATAAGLSRPIKWVRDMIYLGDRLGDEVRQIAMQGLLGVGHLRELAKLGDHQTQADIARWGGGRPGEKGHINLRPVEWFRQQVEQRRRSLKVVPWRLDVTFAGKMACSGCSHNSATDPQLFEMDDPKATKGFCLNQPCFDAKQTAAETAVAKVIERVEQASDDPTPTSIQLAADEADAGMIKRDTLVRSVKKAVGSNAPAKPKTSAGTTNTRKLTPLKEAIKAFRSVCGTWEQNTIRAIQEQAQAEGMTYAILLILLRTRAWVELDETDCGESALWGGQPREPVPDKPLPEDIVAAINLLSLGDVSDQVDAIGKLGAMEQIDLDTQVMLFDTNFTALHAVASAIGADVPPPPAWSDYKPGPKPVKKKVGKKTSKKKASKKPATKASDGMPELPTPAVKAGSTTLEGLISDGVVRAFIEAQRFGSDTPTVVDFFFSVRDIGWPKLRDHLEEHGAMPAQIDQAYHTIARHIAEANAKGE